jgi:hypothetical protein
MQSGPPQGDPRLQRIEPGPEIAVGIVDPCIVFLEATLPGEIPLLAACWARSCREVRSVEGNTCLILRRVLVIQNQSQTRVERRRLWEFGQRKEKAVFLLSGGKDGALVKCDYKVATFATAPSPIFRWHIRYLSAEVDQALESTVTKFGKNPNDTAGLLLRRADMDWPSVNDAMSSIRRHEKRQRRSRSSIVRRLISSIFRKKPQLVST